MHPQRGRGVRARHQGRQGMWLLLPYTSSPTRGSAAPDPYAAPCGSRGCCGKAPHTGHSTQPKLILSQGWRPESKIKVAAAPCSLKGRREESAFLLAPGLDFLEVLGL